MKPAAAEITLQRGQIIALPRGVCHRVEASAGTLWITPGDGRDVVLEAGETVPVGHAGRAIVTALGGAARVRIADMPSLELAA